MNRNFRSSAVLFVVATLVGCGQTQEASNAIAVVEESPAIEVVTSTVSEREVEQLATFTGTIEAKVVNKISPQNPSRITEIFVEVGDRVKKGKKIAQMDDATLVQARIRKENAQAEFDRTNELYKIGGESKSMWDARKLDLDVATSSYENLLENTALISPISGIVTARNYDNGDMYMSGTPLVVVEQISPVVLTINVSEIFYSKVKKGMDVDIVADAYGDESFKGKVTIVYPTIDPSTRTFPVEIEIANGNERMRPGMFTRSTLSFGTATRVVIPDTSVVKQSGSGDVFVYSVDNGKVVLNKVELGQRIGSEYEVISGVEQGAKVITAGQSRLKKGDKVVEQVK